MFSSELCDPVPASERLLAGALYRLTIAGPATAKEWQRQMIFIAAVATATARASVLVAGSVAGATEDFSADRAIRAMISTAESAASAADSYCPTEIYWSTYVHSEWQSRLHACATATVNAIVGCWLVGSFLDGATPGRIEPWATLQRYRAETIVADVAEMIANAAEA